VQSKVGVAKWFTVILPALALVLSSVVSGQSPSPKDQEALKILEKTGVKGGLVVHLGCGDGRLTAALGASERYLVQGLDANPKNVEKARKHIQSLGLYGPVTAEHHKGSSLPFTDNLVNLIVADRTIDTPSAEIIRVLSPEGVAYPDKKTVMIDPTNKPYSTPNLELDRDYEKFQRDWIETKQKNYLKELNEKHGGYNLGDRQFGCHVFATAGFLDDSWFNRTYWMNSETWPGFYIAHRGAKTGQLLVAGPEKTYAVQTYASRNSQSPLFTPGEKGYLPWGAKTHPGINS